jgi:hypothetical protein
MARFKLRFNMTMYQNTVSGVEELGVFGGSKDSAHSLLAISVAKDMTGSHC